MEFRVLGPLEVLDDGRLVDVGGAKQRMVLAVLLLQANRVVSSDQLIEAVWDGRPPVTAQKTLQVYVSQLRKALGSDRIVTRAPGYELRVHAGELDLERFQALVETKRPTEALALWRGQPLADFAYEAFAQAEIARLGQLRLGAVEDRIEAELEAGGGAALTGELETLVREHPLRERLCRQLMLALYRSGRQAEALEAYQQLRRNLVGPLGIEPGPAVRELERKILNHDPSLQPPSLQPAPDRGTSKPSGGRRRVAVGAAATVAVIPVAIAVFLVTRNSTARPTEIAANAVGAIDPESNAVVATIPVGVRPGPVVGAASLWVGNLGDRTLTKIDPRRRSAVATVSLGNRTPTGLAADARAVWVAHGFRGELSRVEPEFGQVVQTIVVTSRASAGSVAVGAGYVWAAYGDSTLARIRPGAGRPDRTALAGAIPAAVTVARRAVWVANSGDATVQRYEPATFDEGPIRTITVGRRPSALAYGDGALWVADSGDDDVRRIDPSTNSTITIHVGDEPVAVAVGAGAVWVANAGDGTVSRIDPATNEVVRTINVGSSPAGVAAAGGLVWVSAQEP
jgi:YVTN family beta-propeller protein